MHPMTKWLESVEFFHGETSLLMAHAQLVWFVGGVFGSWALCSFSTIIRGVKGARGHVDL